MWDNTKIIISCADKHVYSEQYENELIDPRVIMLTLSLDIKSFCKIVYM